MNDIVEPVNDRIRKALEFNDMKQVDLARKMGCSESKISQYLSGKRVPKSSGIYALSIALGVSPVWLLGYDVPMKPEEKSKRQELKEAIDGLTEQQAVILLAFIKTMKE